MILLTGNVFDDFRHVYRPETERPVALLPSEFPSLFRAENDMRENLGKGVRHEEISRGRVKGEIILQRRDFKGNNFMCRAESILSPLKGLGPFSHRYLALAIPQGAYALTQPIFDK
jgi:hypothetical protein